MFQMFQYRLAPILNEDCSVKLPQSAKRIPTLAIVDLWPGGIQGTKLPNYDLVLISRHQQLGKFSSTICILHLTTSRETQYTSLITSDTLRNS